MPFGLNNAPSTFLCTTEISLLTVKQRFALVYPDYVIVFLRYVEEDLKPVWVILGQLLRSSVLLELKTEFFSKDGSHNYAWPPLYIHENDWWNLRTTPSHQFYWIQVIPRSLYRISAFYIKLWTHHYSVEPKLRKDQLIHNEQMNETKIKELETVNHWLLSLAIRMW